MNLQKTHRRCALVFSNKIVLLCFYRKTMNDPSSAGRSVFIVISVSHSNVLQHVFETLSLINSPHSGVTVQFRYVSPGVLYRQQIAHFSVFGHTPPALLQPNMPVSMRHKLLLFYLQGSRVRPIWQHMQPNFSVMWIKHQCNQPFKYVSTTLKVSVWSTTDTHYANIVV